MTAAIDNTIIAFPPSAFLKYLFLLLVASLALSVPIVPVFGQPLAVPDFLFPILFITWAVNRVRSDRRLPPRNFLIALALYFGALSLSAFISPAQFASVPKLVGNAYLIALSVVTADILPDVGVRPVIFAWLAGTLIAVIFGLVVLVLFYLDPNNLLVGFGTFHFGSVPVGNYPRIASTLVSASMFCNYLSVSLALLLAAIELNWIPKLVGWIFVATITVCSIFTISIGIGGIVLIMGVWGWREMHAISPLRAWSSLLLSVAIAGLFLATAFVSLTAYSGPPFKFRVPFTDLNLFPSARLLVWRDAFANFLSAPIFGIGIGNMPARVLFQNTDGSYSLLTDAHNSFLSVATQTGVVGLAAFLYLCFTVLMKGKNWVGGGSHALSFGLFFAFVSAFIYQGLTGAFEDTRHLWVLMGMLAAIRTVEGVS